LKKKETHTKLNALYKHLKTHTLLGCFMKKSINNLIFCTLLLTATQANGEGWVIWAYNFLPFSTTLREGLKENHRIDLVNNLWRFPPRDRSFISDFVTQHLNASSNYRLQDPQLTEELLRNAFACLTEEKTQKIIGDLIAQGQPLDNEAKQFIIEEIRDDVLKRIKNGQSLDSFCDENLKETVYTLLKTQAQQLTQYDIPQKTMFYRR